MNPKLMFVINSDTFFMSHRLPIALEALERGYEVHIATGLCGLKDEMQAAGFIVHPLSINRRSMGFFSNGKTFYQLLRVFKTVTPDIVHLVTIKPVLLGGLAARITAVPSVVAAISGLGIVFVSQGFRANIRRWLVGHVYRLALRQRKLKVIFQNDSDRESLTKLTGLPKKNTFLIRGSGVELAEYSPSPFPSGQAVVTMAARLLAGKGVREFVQAARILRNKGVKARFILVGEPDPGNPTTISKDELNEWVLEKAIEWWGHRDDIPQVFANSTTVVLPSYYGEGLPKVLIEAAACGRAVITTDHPGCRDAIEPDLTGLLVPVRDSDALADAIERLLNSPSFCEEMGQAGRKLATRSFDVQKVVAQHMQIYDELLSSTL